MNSSPNEKIIDDVCPYLGLFSDAQTMMEYPSLQNYCHYSNPKASPTEMHQRQFCLVTKFSECPVLLSKSPHRMPISIRGSQTKLVAPKRLPLILQTSFFIVAAIGLTLWFLTDWLTPSVPVSETPIPIQAITETNSIEFVQSTEQIEISLTATLMPIIETESPVTAAFPKESPVMLETPVLAESTFLLHRVASGEDLITIADTYKTSIEAVQAANFNMPLELWVDTMIVIPIGTVDITNIVPMTPYEIKVDGLTNEIIAREQVVDLNSFRLINRHPDSYVYSIGEWVVLPHPTPPN